LRHRHRQIDSRRASKTRSLLAPSFSRTARVSSGARLADFPSPAFLDELADELNARFASNGDLRNKYELLHDYWTLLSQDARESTPISLRQRLKRLRAASARGDRSLLAMTAVGTASPSNSIRRGEAHSSADRRSETNV
jgi:hypothetical protein